LEGKEGMVKGQESHEAKVNRGSGREGGKRWKGREG